jgi:response regulator NasT
MLGVFFRARTRKGVTVQAPRPRLVVAEDQALIRLDLERLLDAAGFEVCGAARDGLEAVELVLEHHPDLVVLDV